MFSSLRSRLWLSYTVLVVIALLVVAVVLVIYLIRNPVANRQEIARLHADETVILNDEAALASLPPASLQTKSEDYDRTFSARILILSRNRQVLADSRGATAPAIMINPLRPFLVNPTVRDASGQVWLVTLSRISKDRFLILATPRPKVALAAILADEMVPVFTVAGFAAVLLSLLLAYLLTRWIANPLQNIMTAVHSVPSGGARPLKLQGPREVQDLTQAFNAMADRVQSSQKSQRNLVANVSHELKTPLTSIQGFAQAILDGTAGTPEGSRQAAAVIYDEAGRMHRMVLDLLDLARLDAGTADLQRAAVDIPALLNGMAEKFKPMLQAANVSLQVETGSLPAVIGDGDRLAQVFTNLIDNALKYTQAGGRIILRGIQAGNAVQVEVEDNGAGIPPDAQAHIFDRFYQADTSRPGGEKHGAGLGLAIAREIVQAHGGTISVRSALGQGSTFVVHLPLASPDATTLLRHKK